MCSWYFLLRHVKEMLTDVILKNKKIFFIHEIFTSTHFNVSITVSYASLSGPF